MNLDSNSIYLNLPADSIWVDIVSIGVKLRLLLLHRRRHFDDHWFRVECRARLHSCHLRLSVGGRTTLHPCCFERISWCTVGIETIQERVERMLNNALNILGVLPSEIRTII